MKEHVSYALRDIFNKSTEINLHTEHDVVVRLDAQFDVMLVDVYIGGWGRNNSSKQFTLDYSFMHQSSKFSNQYVFIMSYNYLCNMLDDILADEDIEVKEIDKPKYIHSVCELSNNAILIQTEDNIYVMNKTTYDYKTIEEWIGVDIKDYKDYLDTDDINLDELGSKIDEEINNKIKYV